MTPLSTSDHGHHALADAVPACQDPLRFIGRHNFCNLRVCQLSARGVAGALLLNHVQHVVAVRAKPEVLRVDAQPDIATVANENAIWDRAFVDHVGSAMGEVSMPAVFDLPIAPVVLPCVDDAAIIPRRGSLRKTLAKRFHKLRGSLPECGRHALPRTVFRPAQIRRGRGSHKAAGAAHAGKCFGGHITLYHWSLNGYADRLARYEDAKQALA
jgi:hypothetical protein